MKLQYIWIEEFKNIKHQGFNFDPKFEFEFKPELDSMQNIVGGKLTVKDTDYDLPDDFFGKNIVGVTGIVGKNGSGKSSLLDFIKQDENVEENFLNFKFESNYIVVISEPSIFEKVFTTIENIKCNLQKIVKVSSIREVFGKHSDNEINVSIPSILYYNYLLDRKIEVSENLNPNVINLSTYALLKSERNSDYIEKYKSDEIFRILDFIKNFKDFKLPFKLPENSKISFDSYKKFDDFIKISMLSKEHNHISEKILNILISIIQKINSDIYKKTMNANPGSFQYLYTNKRILEFLRSVYFNFIENLNKCNNFNNKKLPIELFENLDETNIIEKLLKYFQSIDNNVHRFVSYILDLYSNNNKFDVLQTLSLDEFERFYNNYLDYFDYFEQYKIKAKNFYNKNIEFIDIKWRNLSFGEETYLSFFARFYFGYKHIYKIKYDYKENILILIDEAEIGFHPQWQKGFLKIIFEVLPKIFIVLLYELITT